MIRIVYFARLREALGRSEEQLPLPRGVATVAGLRAWLGGRGEMWRREIVDAPHLCIALNHDYATDESPVAAGDEVGFFPPVTGG